MEITVIHKNPELIEHFKVFTQAVANVLEIDTKQIIVEFTDSISEGLLLEEGNFKGFGAVKDYNLDEGLFHIQTVYDDKLAQMLLTICHEMIHVSQFLTDRLRHGTLDMERCRPDGSDCQIIQSKGMFWEGGFHSENTPYTKRPWEIEAKELEIPTLKLAGQYMKDNGLVFG